MQHDYYKTLGVQSDASQEEIQVMYRKLAKKYHSDANSQDSNLRDWSHQMMVDLNEAYNVLKSADSRQEYDSKIHNDGQQPHNYAPNQSTEIIQIDNRKAATAILNDGISQIPIDGPNPQQEAIIRKKARDFSKKRPSKYLKLGIPGEYPMEYLRSAVTNIIADSIERFHEKALRFTVGNAFSTLTVISGFFYALTHDYTFFKSLLYAWVSGLIFIAYYYLLTWGASIVAHIIGTNLVGRKGWTANILVGLLFMPPSVTAIYQTQNPPKSPKNITWHRAEPDNGNFSIFFPQKTFESITTPGNGLDGSDLHRLEVTTKEAQYGVHWFSHPDVEFASLINASKYWTDWTTNPNSPDFELESSRRVERPNRTFQEVVLKSDDNPPVVFTYNIYIDRTTSYAVYVVTDSADAVATSKFLKSFVLY